MIQTTGYPELDEIAQRLDRVRALDARELEAEEIALLGRKAGALTALLKRVAGLPIEERKRYGALVNQLKGQFESAFAERREEVAAEGRRQGAAGLGPPKPARRPRGGGGAPGPPGGGRSGGNLPRLPLPP